MAKIFYIHLKDEKQVMGYFFNNKRKAEEEGSGINDDFEFGLNGVTMGTPTFGRKDVYSGEIDIKKGLLFYRERLTGEVKMEDMLEEDAKSIIEEIDGVGSYFPAKLKSGQSNAFIKRQGVNAKGALWSFYYGNILENRKPVMKYLLTNEQFLNEAKSDFVVYHNQYSSVIDEVERYANNMGYKLDQEEYGNAYVDAFFKPNDGQTKKDTLTLYKGGKEQRKALHVRIYGMGNKFELNMYIN